MAREAGVPKRRPGAGLRSPGPFLASALIVGRGGLLRSASRPLITRLPGDVAGHSAWEVYPLFRGALQWLRSPFRRPWRSLAILSLVMLIGLGLGLTGLHLWAAYHYRSARQCLDRYRLAEAREHIEVCLHVLPSSFEVR